MDLKQKPQTKAKQNKQTNKHKTTTNNNNDKKQGSKEIKKNKP